MTRRQPEPRPIQRPGPRPRGRPRKYVRETVLDQATALFRRQGFDGTSLDMLAAATGLVRPSLAGGFGTKADLFHTCLDRYMADIIDRFAADPDRPETVQARFDRFLTGLVELYVGGEDGPEGCFAFCTATAIAPRDDRVREMLQQFGERLDSLFEDALIAAQQLGEIPAQVVPRLNGRLATALIQSLAIRARSGTRTARLTAFARQSIPVICGV